MCHGWRRTRGSPLFSVCTHNKIDDFWRWDGRGAGGWPGAADPYILVSLPRHTPPGMERGQKKGRGKREEMSLCSAAGLGSCLGPYVGPGLGMLLCAYSHPRNQKRILLSYCWISALTPEHAMELHHPQPFPHASSGRAALLHLKLSPGQEERTSPRDL